METKSIQIFPGSLSVFSTGSNWLICEGIVTNQQGWEDLVEIEEAYME